MKKLFVKIVFVTLVTVFAGVNVYKSQKASHYNLLLAQIHTLATETIDGGDLPEVVITCGRFDGQCYHENWRSRNGWYWSCKFTGFQEDHCIDCPFL